MYKVFILKIQSFFSFFLLSAHKKQRQVKIFAISCLSAQRFDLYIKVSWPWYYWYLGRNNSICCAGCPMHCRTFYGAFGLYPLDANSNLSSQVDTIIAKRALGGGAKSSPIGKHSSGPYCPAVCVSVCVEEGRRSFWAPYVLFLK